MKLTDLLFHLISTPIFCLILSAQTYLRAPGEGFEPSRPSQVTSFLD
jgi:hypothetical protein